MVVHTPLWIQKFEFVPHSDSSRLPLLVDAAVNAYLFICAGVSKAAGYDASHITHKCCWLQKLMSLNHASPMTFYVCS